MAASLRRLPETQSCSHALQILHEITDEICGRKGPRFASFPKVITIRWSYSHVGCCYLAMVQFGESKRGDPSSFVSSGICLFHLLIFHARWMSNWATRRKPFSPLFWRRDKKKSNKVLYFMQSYTLVLSKQSCSIGGNSLKDFDWNVKVSGICSCIWSQQLIMASDKMATLQQPVASITLQVWWKAAVDTQSS